MGKRSISLSFILIIIGCIFLINVACAKDLFVAIGGNDSVTYADNNINNPWASILKAMQTVQAGDTVYFRQGTYNIPSGGITITTGFSAGIATSPILFTSYPNELATWRSTQTNVTIRVGRDHWHFDNLNFVHEPSGSMSGDRGFFQCGYSTTGANGFWVKNSTFSMNSRGDNYGSVHLKMESGGCNQVEITNNVITHSGGTGLTNSSGIIAFGNKTFKINNNIITGPPIGIYLKHASTNDTYNCATYDAEVKNNWVRRNERRAFFNNFNCTRIENNIFDGRGSSGDSSDAGGAQFNENNGVAGSDNCIINHNTFLGGVHFNEDGNGVQNAIFTNNLVYDRVFNIHPYTNGASGDGNIDADYNLYKASTAVRVDNSNYTLANWRTVSGEDSRSLSGTPTFVSTAFDSIEAFALTSTSLGYRAGSDGKNIGADVSLVGVDYVRENKPPEESILINVPSGFKLN